MPDEIKLLRMQLSDIQNAHLKMFQDMNYRINNLENKIDELIKELKPHEHSIKDCGFIQQDLDDANNDNVIDKYLSR